MRYNAAGLSNLVASGLENWSCAPLDFGAWSLLRGASSFQMHVNEKDGMMRSSCKKSGETTACVASLDVCVPTKDNFFVAKCHRPRLSRFFFSWNMPLPDKNGDGQGCVWSSILLPYFCGLLKLCYLPTQKETLQRGSTHRDSCTELEQLWSPQGFSEQEPWDKHKCKIMNS